MAERKTSGFLKANLKRSPQLAFLLYQNIFYFNSCLASSLFTPILFTLFIRNWGFPDVFKKKKKKRPRPKESIWG